MVNKPMRAIYHFENYKDYLNYRISVLPKEGRGEFLKISKYLNVHTSLISQVLRGVKEFSPEQAMKVAEYFGLVSEERHYFITMINLSRSGTKELREYYLQYLDKMKSDYFTVKKRVKKAIRLNDNQKSQYYSDWKFMAVWLATSLEKVVSIDDIQSELEISKKDISKIIDFLISVGLCVNDKGTLQQGISTTHLDKESLLINRHHANWRLKALEKLENTSKDELYFTAPLTISEKDMKRIKESLLDAIENASSIVSKTKPEKLACLNIDLFNI